MLADSVSGDETLARALTAHVRERLGGLAQPRAIAFFKAFPPELPDDLLRQPLRQIWTTGPAETFRISAERLRAAGSGAAPHGP